MNALRFLSLYSGIGLHDLGFQRAGIEIVGQVELDPFCAAVLEKHWPGLPRWSDVRHVTTADVRKRCGRIDGITGGFSCQDISVAGQGKGIGRETRSGITWRNMFRLIRGLRPLWLVIENVPRLRTLAADRVIAALERIGYACWSLVVGAEHVRAPHRRHRVWIIGFMADSVGERCERRQGNAAERIGHRAAAGWQQGDDQPAGQDSAAGLADPISEHRGCWDQQPKREAQERAAADGTGSSGGVAHPASGGLGANGSTQRDAGHADIGCSGVGLADTHRSGCGESGGTVAVCAELAAAEHDRSHRWPARPGEAQHEWEAARLTQSGVGGAVDGRPRRLAGFARRNALKALGNGNPPQVAEVIARIVVQAAGGAR